MRLLLVKTSSMGDLIHTFPALTDALRAIPALQVDWVVEEGFAALPAWHPAVSRVVPVALRRWRRHPWQAWRSGEWAAFRASLRQPDHALVLDAQGLLKSAGLTRLARPVPVAGPDWHSAREPLASLFYDRRYPMATGQHAIVRLRQLFAAALDYPLPETPVCYGLDRQKLQPSRPAVPYLVFLHGTTWPSKHWPEARWRQLAGQLVRRGWAIRLPWGSPAEQARARRLADGLPGVEVLPGLDLAGVARVLAGASGCVAVDTGLGHLAAALAVPCVSLYGPTRPERVGAWGPSQLHLCARGPHAGRGDRQQPCMDSLSTDQVRAALESLLSIREPH
mgnify:CR=1 FL=1